MHWDQAPRGIGETGAAAGGSPSPPAERHYDIKIDRHGQWHHEGRPIARLPLVKLFATVLQKQSDGSYWLVTPVERGRIQVEDVPFVVVEMVAEGVGREHVINVRSNLDEWITIGPDHPLLLRKPLDAPPAAPSDPAGSGPETSVRDTLAPDTLIPYVDIRSGLEGRLLRPVYYDLVDHCEPHQQDGVTRYGVWSNGQFFALDEQPL